MKYRQEAMSTAGEDSDQEQDIAIMDAHEPAQFKDVYATTYTAEEDNTLHYTTIFLTELRTIPPVAANLSQLPRQYVDLLRFPVDQAVRLFDDAYGNAWWLSADALYMHERVIQQDRVRRHPAADPIEKILQRARRRG
ncbi:hypothetical protein AC579_4679 [Pseudocercospora musae]|uniref:Uncharacterized protein n=1 Tax=Pseudocercospora musae TaxID=113226 RepID=A0A139GTI8_9PEZI|nr:hypothetical protein AC579_4679 [Pseudocercospora musae]